MTKFVLLFSLYAMPLLCQSNRGELHLQLTDPAGLGVSATVDIASKANQYRRTLAADDHGSLVVQRLPYGIYLLHIQRPGFADLSTTIDIHSSLPTESALQLRLATVKQSIDVAAVDTLIDPDQAGSVSQIGSGFIRDRPGSVPGRDLQDLVNSQPGWLYEGNAVLHPRGSEYQTQFVVDGIPLIDNRSPSFGPQIEAGDVESMSIYTAGIPAEYGRKLGGIVEVNTLPDPIAGFHGQAVLSGGSFASAGAFAKAQYVWGRNTLGGSANGSRTDRYLNPVVPENFSNTGTLGDFSLDYARDLTSSDRAKFIVRREVSRYDIPNEIVQQQAGQRQTADNLETIGIASWDHTFSAHATGDLRTMVRDNATGFNSNPLSTPIEIAQHNGFREAYLKAGVTFDQGRSEWKAGVESDNLFLHEMLNYTITDPTQFDDGSPAAFAYQASRPDLEQSAFLEDTLRLHHWTIDAGLRWDHYQLLLNRQAFQPRLAVARYFPSAAAVIHFSYDRVFQTPSFENILLSSSPQVASIDPAGFLRLPVQPSQGNYYEAGLTKVFCQHIKLAANYFRRDVDNFADDSQIDNTTISFPIAFHNAIIYGLEGKLEVPDWRRLSGFASYSYMVGNVWSPVTGGLFFGADAAAAASQLTGHMPNTQDQRHTVRGRLRYQAASRLWVAAGLQYDSGLPFDFDGDPSTVLTEYGPQVLNRINFARGRIYPAFQANASIGADMYKSERANVTLQADGQNLNNLLNVIDFGGLFSGNAIGPPRSFALRLTTTF
ncbi:MAG TPA: TonB-dependent receptor [Acidobacteriaceae bacterium]|nr:TonB-dependent receptor [Acidobacteriaceae bacterium]